MVSLWKLGNLGWRELAKRVWSEVQEDEVFSRAAELSYYFLLALFPFLIFLTSILGFMLGSGSDTRQTLFQYLARVMPPSAYQLISSTMTEVSASRTSGSVVGGV
jgi:membrane protein